LTMYGYFLCMSIYPQTGQKTSRILPHELRLQIRLGTNVCTGGVRHNLRLTRRVYGAYRRPVEAWVCARWVGMAAARRSPMQVLQGWQGLLGSFALVGHHRQTNGLSFRCMLCGWSAVVDLLETERLTWCQCCDSNLDDLRDLGRFSLVTSSACCMTIYRFEAFLCSLNCGFQACS
jgi:hypothetical protein